MTGRATSPAKEEAPPAPGVLDELAGTFAAGRRVISDFLTLATLEARQAGMSAMWMVAGGAAAAILGVSAWLALMAALAICAVEWGVPWALAVFLVALANLGAAAAALYVCIKLSRNLLFTATRRQLSGKHSDPPL